jgi:uncharacterized protein with FMN-binding domain
MSQGASKNKIANGLVSASCAAVLAVYAAGYTRTQSAANRLATQVAVRRAAVPESARTTVPMPGLQPALPDQPSRAAIVKPSIAEPAKPTIAAASEPADIPTTSAAISSSVSAPVEPIATEVKAEVKAEAVEPKKDAPAATPVWKDGVYRGWGYSRHGNIEAEVVIEKGRIASAGISQCRTRYSCSVIENLPPQVALRQSPEVDYVSGATQSADAFYGAVVEALNKAK